MIIQTAVSITKMSFDRKYPKLVDISSPSPYTPQLNPNPSYPNRSKASKQATLATTSFRKHANRRRILQFSLEHVMFPQRRSQPPPSDHKKLDGWSTLTRRTPRPESWPLTDQNANFHSRVPPPPPWYEKQNARLGTLPPESNGNAAHTAR